MNRAARIARCSRGYPVVIVDDILIGDCDLYPGQTEDEAMGYLTTVAKDYELALRIYRTPGGLRIVCVSDFLRPCAPVSLRLLEDFASDSRYNEIVQTTKEFTARLGGKPNRMGLQTPKDFDYYALLPKEQRDWDTTYDAISFNYRACEFVLQTSDERMPSEIANFITLHDERTKCFSDLPMA